MRLHGQSTARDFIDHLVRLRFRGVFNPYAEACPTCDKAEAATIRCRNLESVLDAALQRRVASIWVARDLGYRGGRRTGLALTDEVNLPSHAAQFGIPKLHRATTGPIVAERTADVVWKMLRMIDQPVFLWNVFPLHPHGIHSPMTNRRHTRAERQECSCFLEWLIMKLRPRTVVGLGRDAFDALNDMHVRAAPIRHPSFGGQHEFMSGIAKLYDL